MGRRLLALVAVVMVAVGPAAATLAPPRLHLVSREPLRVRGTDFRGGERATVTLASPIRRVRHLTVAASGRFLASFGDALSDPCSGFFVRVVGSSGDHAVLRGSPLPQCPPP